MKSFVFLIFCTLQSIFLLSQQTGGLSGEITDRHSTESLPFVNVRLSQEANQSYQTTTDFDGKYHFKSIPVGVYKLEVSFVGYNPTVVKGIKILADTVLEHNLTLEAGVELDEVEIVQYKKPLIHKDGGASGGAISIRGARSEGVFFQSNRTVYEGYINTSREQYNSFEDNQFESVSEAPLSTFSLDVDRAAYSNIRRFLNDGLLPPKDAVRVEEMINYFEYDYPAPQDQTPMAIHAQLTSCPWEEQHQLLHIGIKAKDFEGAIPQNNLVFLIDVSGSMMSANKLPLLKRGMKLLVDQLRPEDRVAIVVYAGAAGLVLPSTSGAEKDEIKSAIDQLAAGGSTAGGAGINLAYKVAKKNFIEEGNNRVILATDGDFNVGVATQTGLIRLIKSKREHDIFLSVLGFGTGNLQDGMMEQMANKGNGNYSYIDNIREAKKVLINEFESTMVTVAKDVKTQIEFNPAQVSAYRMIGYVNRKLEAKDFNDDKKDAGEVGAGHTVTLIYELVPAGVESPQDSGIDELRYQKEIKRKDVIVLPQFASELATIKCRYKDPTGSKSKLFQRTIPANFIHWDEVDANVRFSVAVAHFGQALRLEEKDNARLEKIAKWAKSAKGQDVNGYRAEFIQLVELAMLLEE